LGVGAGIPTTTRVIADGQADGANLSASTAVSSVTFTSVAGDIYGGAAPDSITAGPNYVNGAWDPEEGSDPPAYIDGGASQDVITVGLAASQRQESVNSFPLVVHGGPDSDFIDASSSQGDVYYGQGFGDDMFIGGSGNDGIGVGNGAHGADRLYGGPGNDLFVSYQGNDGGDRAYGGPGNDKFIGISPGGSVDFDGGAGVDTVAYEDEGVNVPHVSRIALDDLADDGPNGTDNIRSTVENISTQGVTNVGLSGDNVLVGNYLSNNIHGGGGNDTITGGGGTDVLFGEVGNDNIQATDGQVDTINCGSGTDTVDADAIDIINADCEPQFLTTH
jgi:Ca2+-binding RTX toxin-like protein